MAEGTSMHLFAFLVFLLSISSSGTLAGFSYETRNRDGISSPVENFSFKKLLQESPSEIRFFVQDLQALDALFNTSFSVDLYINETTAENLRNQEPSAISWLKTHFRTFLPHMNVKSMIVSGSRHDLPGENTIPVLLSTLRSIHLLLASLHLESQINVSISFSLPFLENLNGEQRRNLHATLDLIQKIRSLVIVEASVDGELCMGDSFVESLIQKATSAAYVLPCSKVAIVLKIKNSAFPNPSELSEFTDKILKNIPRMGRKLTGVLVEIPPPKEEQIFQSSHRELLVHSIHKTLHDTLYPPTTPVTIPPYNNPSPTIVTFPPANPTVTIPPNNPVPLPFTNPTYSPVPITNPVTTPGTVPGAQPITNPVTTYPSPTAGVPVATPVTNPVAPPATMAGTPAVQGQSWCVARSGAMETALQTALDYACGIGGVDCSAIQDGASCYNPNTLENHASYAFNNYYQKNPVQTSCDFGGTAIITNVNPSTGACIFQSSSASSSSPGTTGIPTPTAASSSGAAATGPGSGSPPAVENTGNPATVFDASPPSFNSSTSSMATTSQPFIGCMILVTSMAMGISILGM